MSMVLKVAGGVLLALLVLIVGCSALISSGTDSSDNASSQEGPRSLSGNSEFPPAGDVELAGCETDEFGYMTADLQVTNRSPEASTYSITVAFESPDGGQQFDTGAAFVDGLEPSQMRTATASSLTEAPGDFECRVSAVDRFASAGS